MAPSVATIHVVLPHHRWTLAQVGNEVKLHVEGRVMQRSALDALEPRYPMLCGTMSSNREPFGLLSTVGPILPGEQVGVRGQSGGHRWGCVDSTTERCGWP